MIKLKVCCNGDLSTYVCNLIVADTVSGMIGIKSDHCNLITQVKSGFIRTFNEEGKEEDQISVESGLLQFNNKDNTCVVTLMK